MPDSVSPVSDPARYQAMLLNLAGPGDPAISTEATASELQALVVEAGDRLRNRPAPGEWSVLELIGHIVDAEMVSSTRLRWVLAQERPDLPGYEQDDWVSALHHNDADPGALIATFEVLRAANVALWRSTPIALRSRIGVHRERGDESFELIFRLLAGHDRFHINQARATLAELRD